jgi:hypothetical protein
MHRISRNVILQAVRLHSPVTPAIFLPNSQVRNGISSTEPTAGCIVSSLISQDKSRLPYYNYSTTKTKYNVIQSRTPYEHCSDICIKSSIERRTWCFHALSYNCIKPIEGKETKHCPRIVRSTHPGVNPGPLWLMGRSLRSLEPQRMVTMCGRDIQQMTYVIVPGPRLVGVPASISLLLLPSCHN